MNNVLNVNSRIENLNKKIVIANKLLADTAANAKALQNSDSNQEAALKDLLNMVRERMRAMEINTGQVWEAVRIGEGHKKDELWTALKLVMRLAAVKECLREPKAMQNDKEAAAWEETRVAALQVELLASELQVAKLSENMMGRVTSISMPQQKLSIILKAEMNIVKTQALLQVTELQVAEWRK